ncbi:MAG: transposase [Candidatus Staskawiczbacteria bacterium]|nr:transposase [Candidatus Staskawiczbacteria bacterium]
MPRRKEQFDTGGIYHIIIRALDENLIFKNIDDYFRGVFSIYEFNNLKPVNISVRRRNRKTEKKKEKMIDLGARSVLIDKREKIVGVLAFCFMPNHLHLLLKQIKDGGISKFMQKVGGGYGRYFNDKYQRKGHVFQDAFRSIQIENDNQFMATASYIFTNPIALIEPGWKELGIRNHSVDETVEFLENYKWSSYQDCIGIENFPSVTEREFLLEMTGEVEGLKKIIKDWVEHKKDVAKYSELFLE